MRANADLARATGVENVVLAEDETTFDEIKQPIIDALDASIADGATDPYQLQQVVRRVVGRWVNRAHRRRPMIIPVVIEA